MFSNTTQLMISILFFAPGLVILAGGLFWAVLTAVDQAVTHRGTDLQLAANVPVPAAGNPQPGRIVAALKASMQEEGAARRRAR